MNRQESLKNLNAAIDKYEGRSVSLEGRRRDLQDCILAGVGLLSCLHDESKELDGLRNEEDLKTHDEFDELCESDPLKGGRS